ncbi:MAG: hypothetical protein GF398_15905 [Chitinivibrionales bacterium]|nr:hypothetical protein [Chitinivibrionales bacterium]
MHTEPLLKSKQIIVGRQVFFIFAGAMILACALYGPAAASDAQQAVENHFASYDQLLSTIASSEKARLNNLDNADEYLLSIAQENPAVTSLIRTNSSGKIINQVNDGKVMPRRFRNVGRQSWHRTIARTNEPYYGKLLRHGVPRYLFWAKPIDYKRAGGNHFGGTVAIKVDIPKALKLFDEKYDGYFEVKIGNSEIYSSSDPRQGEMVSGASIALEDISNMTISYSKTEDKPQVADTSAKQVVAGKEKKTNRSTVALPGLAKDAPTQKGGKGGAIIMGVVLLAAAVGLVLIFIVAIIRTNKKRADLIKEIDNS